MLTSIAACLTFQPVQFIIVTPPASTCAQRTGCYISMYRQYYIPSCIHLMHSLFSSMPSEVPVESVCSCEDPLADRALFMVVFGSSPKDDRVSSSLAGPFRDEMLFDRVVLDVSPGPALKVDSPSSSLASCNSSQSMASMRTRDFSTVMLQQEICDTLKANEVCKQEIPRPSTWQVTSCGTRCI